MREGFRPHMKCPGCGWPRVRASRWLCGQEAGRAAPLRQCAGALGMNVAFAGRHLTVTIAFHRELMKQFPNMDLIAEYRSSDVWLDGLQRSQTMAQSALGPDEASKRHRIITSRHGAEGRGSRSSYQGQRFATLSQESRQALLNNALMHAIGKAVKAKGMPCTVGDLDLRKEMACAACSKGFRSIPHLCGGEMYHEKCCPHCIRGLARINAAGPSGRLERSSSPKRPISRRRAK